MGGADLNNENMLSALKSGLGIRPELFSSVEGIDHATDSKFGFLEAHSENYFGESIARAKLLTLRQDYPLSLHGVGLSLGRADDLDQQHIAELKKLVDQLEPVLVSEHLAWSAYSHRHLPDLLPLPLTSQSLNIVCQHIDQMQTALGRQILIENPSNYLLFDQLQIPEPEFLNTLAERTGCGLLMDLNNIHVSAANLGRDGVAYIDAVNSKSIGQYHLAGYTEVEREHQGISETVLIDTHNQTVYDPVWELFDHALSVHGARPTLFEWDSDFPEFEVLVSECQKANALLQKYPSELASITKPVDFPDSQDSDLAQSQDDFLNCVLSLNQVLETARPEHQQRIWIYQNNVFAAVQDYLQEVYPATRGVVGADFFKQMAQVFIQNAPPTAGNIHLYGESLAELCGSLEGLEKLPYLFDLMRYEWALHNSYFSIVSDALEPGSIPQEQLLSSSVSYNDSVSLIYSDYPIYEIQRQSLPSFEGEVSIDLQQSQDQLLVYKLGHQVQSLVLGAEQALFIKGLEESQNLLQAIEGLQGSISADTLSTTLSLMFEIRLLKLS
ncbi:MAG: hypothetical protein ACJAQ6_001745 [Arenicella sp.]|jgi:uncharacterized protein (UPF0276 family)